MCHSSLCFYFDRLSWSTRCCSCAFTLRAFLLQHQGMKFGTRSGFSSTASHGDLPLRGTAWLRPKFTTIPSTHLKITTCTTPLVAHPLTRSFNAACTWVGQSILNAKNRECERWAVPLRARPRPCDSAPCAQLLDSAHWRRSCSGVC